MKRKMRKMVLTAALAGILALSCRMYAGADENVEDAAVAEEVPDEITEEFPVDNETEYVEELPEEEMIEIEVDEGDGIIETDSGVVDVFADPVESESEEVESPDEAPDDSVYLWQYQYAGVPNVYLSTICEWLTVYHLDQGIPETGMIPAISVVGVDDSDRNDIRVYCHIAIVDYELDGTSLADVKEEFLTGCMHLQQLSEDEYIVTAAEVLDSGNPTGSAISMTNGDLKVMQGLLMGSMREAVRAQYVRDFVRTYGLGVDSYKDLEGKVHSLDYGVDDIASPEWVASSVEAECTDQIVTVGMTEGCNAILMLHEKQEDGSWKCLMEVPALIGKEGLGKTREGDGRTPVGAYGFTEGFGTQEDPGSQFPYTQIDESYYWVSDPASGRYNQLVSTAEYTDFNEEAGEKLYSDGYAYHYSISTSFNEEGIPYAGSGIFIHGIPQNRFWTEGCVAVPESAMVYLLQRLKPNARLIIDTEKNLKDQYRSAASRGAVSVPTEEPETEMIFEDTAYEVPDETYDEAVEE